MEVINLDKRETRKRIRELRKEKKQLRKEIIERLDRRKVIKKDLIGLKQKLERLKTEDEKNEDSD